MNPHDEPSEILLVEDNPGDAELVRIAIGDDPSLMDRTRIVHATTLGKAKLVLATRPIDLVLLDLGLPDSQGLDGLRTIREEHPSVAVIVFTGCTDRRSGLAALEFGAVDYVSKGWAESDDLRSAVVHGLARRRLSGTLGEAKRDLDAATERRRDSNPVRRTTA